MRIGNIKRNIKKLAAIALASLIFVGCGIDNSKGWQDNAINVIDDKYRNYYEVFVYSYADSDNDGIGDLNGLDSKLDYIQDLGINGLWLMPIMPSDSYHKYDTNDYCGVDPQYGTMEDFDKLIADCHAKGIRVIIDLAMNHSGSNHPWFTQACDYIKSLKAGQTPSAEECPYVDYYNFSQTMESGYANIAGTNWYYEAQFSDGMPDLNLDNPQVRTEFENIASFWLDKGVDGFRLDAVKYYDLGNDDNNISILTWFNDYVKSVNEDAYIVCENWSTQQEYAPYYASGVDSMFDFDFANKDGIIANVLNGKSSAKSWADALVSEEELYASYSENYINAPFYTNHDMGRSAGYYAGDNSEAQAKMAEAMNLLTSGNSFLYYGEEIGMKGSGKDENKRAPMQWTSDSTGEYMCKGPDDMEQIDMKYGSLEDQQQDECSIYNFVKDVLMLKNQYPEIARGKTTSIDDLTDSELAAIKKTYQDDSIVLLFNLSAESKEVDLSQCENVTNLTIVADLLTSEGDIKVAGSKLTMPAFSVVALK